MAFLLAAEREDRQGVSRLHQAEERETAACPLEERRPGVGREEECWEAYLQGLGACREGRQAGRVD